MGRLIQICDIWTDGDTISMIAIGNFVAVTIGHTTHIHSSYIITVPNLRRNHNDRIATYAPSPRIVPACVLHCRLLFPCR